MRELVEDLLRLQELEIVLQESRIVHQTAASAELKPTEKKIAELRDRVPTNALRRYDKMKTAGLGVARERNGVCSGCHLNINVGDIHRMRRGDMEWICPNCGRFLFLSKSAVKAGE